MTSNFCAKKFFAGTAERGAAPQSIFAQRDSFFTVADEKNKGLSLKTFLAQKRELPPKRKAQTLAAQLVALQNGADILRVHDVRDTRKIMDFYTELEQAQ